MTKNACEPKNALGQGVDFHCDPILEPLCAPTQQILSVGGQTLQRLALIGPFKWLSHRAVEIIHKGFQLTLQVGQRNEVASANHLARQDAKPDFDLIHPRGVFWGVTKANPMSGIAQKTSAAFLTLENSLLALDSQNTLGDDLDTSHISNQAFRLVGV